jgi:hypothetical protein
LNCSQKAQVQSGIQPVPDAATDLKILSPLYQPPDRKRIFQQKQEHPEKQFATNTDAESTCLVNSSEISRNLPSGFARAIPPDPPPFWQPVVSSQA